MTKVIKTGVCCAFVAAGLMVSSQVVADSGLYFGGSIGKARVDENIDNLQFRSDSNAFRVFGGYAFNDYIALEASYLDLGTFRDTFDIGGETVEVSADADGFSFAGVGSLPLSERFSLQGRAGLFFWDGQSTVAGITENDPGDQNAFAGAGIAFALTDRARLSFDVDYYDLSDAQPLVASLAVSFRF